MERGSLDPAPVAGFTIRPAGTGDFAIIPELEARADAIYLDLPGFADLLDHPNLASQNFSDMGPGTFVLIAETDSPVGFAYCLDVDDCTYLSQLSVVPEVQGRGIGAGLLEAVCEKARVSGKRGVVLTTFLELAWNAPFYVRHGFSPLRDSEMGSELATHAAADFANWGRYAKRVVLGRFF